MRNLILTSVVAAVMVLAAGCGEDVVTDTTVGAGGDDPLAAKGDCPNCGESGPNAFIQAGLETRWYQPGDVWHVAFQFRNRGIQGMEDFLRPTQGDQWATSGVYLYRYEATRASRDVFANQWREIIEIEVTQADVDATQYGSSGYFEQERLDRYEQKIAFTMNDLTNALEVTRFSRKYPNGRTTDAPARHALALTDTDFPVSVPRLLAGAKSVVAPELPTDLAVIADALGIPWRDRSYKKFELENGDVVYWAQGHLWPFYIENAQGRGLLLDGLAPQEAQR